MAVSELHTVNVTVTLTDGAGRGSIIAMDDTNQAPHKVRRSNTENSSMQSDTPVPPDGGYGYVIVFAAFVSNVVVDGISYSFGSLKDSIYDDFTRQTNSGNNGIEKATVTWIGSILTGTYACLGPFVGVAINRFGFRSVAIVGSVTSTAGFILAWYLNLDRASMLYLCIFYGVVGGIGLSCIYVPAVVAVGFYFEKKRALATGIAVCGSGLGTFIFPPLIDFLIGRWEWQGAILGLGLIVFGSALLGILYKPLKSPSLKMGTEKRGSSKSTDTSHQPSRGSNSTNPSGHTSIEELFPTKKLCWSAMLWKTLNDLFDFSLLSSPCYVVLAFSNLFGMMGIFVPFVYLMDQAEFILSKGENAPEQSALTMLLSLIGAANIVGRILSGWLADRPWISALLINNIALTVMGASAAAVPFLTRYFHFVIFSLVFGFCVACFNSLRSILLVEFIGLKRLTNAFGILMVFIGIGATVATPIAGTIAGLHGSEEDFSLAFFVAGGCLVFSAVICYPLSIVNKRETNRNVVL